MSRIKDEKFHPFLVYEQGSERCGWVGMGLFGLCGVGKTRQAAWDDWCTQMNARLEAQNEARTRLG